jgi:hypothetical protein
MLWSLTRTLRYRRLNEQVCAVDTRHFEPVDYGEDHNKMETELKETSVFDERTCAVLKVSWIKSGGLRQNKIEELLQRNIG